MKHVFSFSLFFICFSFFLLSAEEEVLVARLATENALTPLYVLPFEGDKSQFGDNYLHQLQEVLVFDLGHNGYSSVLPNNAAYNRLVKYEDVNQMGSAQEWKANHIYYVVRMHAEGESLKTLILDVSNQTLKSAEPFAISGNLNQDRRQMHRLADQMVRTLFGQEGIASTKILYTVKTKPSLDSSKWIAEVWEADYDGANPRQLTHANSYCVTPIYLPAKPGYTTGGFLYVSYQLGQPKIYLASLKEGVGRRLTPMRGNQLMPSVSWQRDKVAFINDITGNPDLFLQPFTPEQGAIGKPQQIFSAKQATQGSPTFSPDGKRIAFVSDKDGSPKIYVINIPAPGSSLKDIQATLISKTNRENSAPAWSPDGSKIAYCARSKGERQIWIYDFKTNQEKQVTQGAGNKENPSWAPNNLHLVFNSSNPQSNELFFINLNQAEAVKIPLGMGDKQFPNWEPRLTL